MSFDLDPERRLALAYVPAPQRPALEALWRLDVALASVLVTGSEPMISRIRLAWWRESLEKLDQHRPPGEPVLQAVAGFLLPRGIGGAELGAMEEGWARLASPEPLTTEDLDLYARCRGGLLFTFAARLLGASDKSVAPAGEAWALIDFARHSSNPDEAAAARAAAAQRVQDRHWPASLRPIGMLALLASRDARSGEGFEPQGSPRRMLRMLRHRLTGR